MLSDELYRAQSGDNVTRLANVSLVADVAAAPKFVLDREAVGMTLSLQYGRPSTLLSALPFTRVPYPKIWVESLSGDVTEANARYGFDARTGNPDGERLKRTGMLISVDRGNHQRFSVMPAVSFPSGEVSISPIGAYIDTSDDIHPTVSNLGRETAADALAAARTRGMDALADRMERFFRDPREVAAFEDTHNRGRLVPTMYIQAAARQYGVSGHLDLPPEAVAGFSQMASAAGLMATRVLMLLNLKNGTELLSPPPQDKLNKARARSGKPPLFDHRILTIRPPRMAAAPDGTPGAGLPHATRAHWVRGHIKVRAKGIFWWSHHIRGDAALGFADKDYLVRG